ncbi:hypothetical protein [Vibrio alginolyticus]|uniref:hypothetical protein n=1 Tax=Vibrio alginolyticus TaxID=663 RepID=UPI000B04C15A|nr:hypothetical protein [Vibrio alginolyticus]
MNNQKPLYSISYDLNSPGQRHRNLSDYLSELGAQRVMETHWLLVSTDFASASAIKIELMQEGLVDDNDVLLISEITNNMACSNIL